MNNWWALAVAGPALAIVSTAATRWLGRWLGRAITSSLNEAVVEVVKPDLDQITGQLDTLRTEGVVTGSGITARLDAHDARITGVEARVSRIESHLTISED